MFCVGRPDCIAGATFADDVHVEATKLRQLNVHDYRTPGTAVTDTTALWHIH
jgi:hypothetical protein